MSNPEILSISDDLSTRRHLLSQEIRALELGPDASGQMRLGPVSTIPTGSEVECCGQGFNTDTVKICWRGKFYFIFREDFETHRKPTARCASCGE